MKLIGSDYDGTLNYQGFDDEKREALARWRAAGNVFAVVSGRPMKNLLQMWQTDGLPYDYLVANNGAVVCHVDGTKIAEIRCAGEWIRPLMEVMFAHGCPWCDIHAGEIFRVFATAHEPMGEGEWTLDTLPPITYFTQISTMLSDLETTAAVTTVLKDMFKEQLNPLQNGICIDVVHHTVNKAVGLCTLAQHLNVSEKDIIAVGDNMNDTDMIAAFSSYAMENGVDSIKALAGRTTPSVTALIKQELQNMR